MRSTSLKINIEQFKNINTKEVSYFLGFMWSDGYIRQYVSTKGILNSKVSLEICKEDAEHINYILCEIGQWAVYKRKRKDSWKETWTYSTNHRDLYQFLEENDYVDKSSVEPTKILDKIPDNFKPYFWKGVVDGDGSLGLSGRGAYFGISSTYEYGYIELVQLLKSLNITRYNIYRHISKKGHKSSLLKVYGSEILKIEKIMLEYGLLRKTDKFKLIKNKYEKQHPKSA